MAASEPAAEILAVTWAKNLCKGNWWTWSGSNRRPLPCHGSALPAAPQAHVKKTSCTILAHLQHLVKQTQSESGLRKTNKMSILNRASMEYRLAHLLSEDEPLMINKHLTAAFLSVIALAVLSQAQATAAAQAVSYPSITELNQLVANLQQTSQSAQLDLARLRVEKWKADSGTKQQTEKDSASINQNLQMALPGMLADLKNSPENLTLTFKVYRTLDLLY